MKHFIFALLLTVCGSAFAFNANAYPRFASSDDERIKAVEQSRCRHFVSSGWEGKRVVERSCVLYAVDSINQGSLTQCAMPDGSINRSIRRWVFDSSRGLPTAYKCYEFELR